VGTPHHPPAGVAERAGLGPGARPAAGRRADHDSPLSRVEPGLLTSRAAVSLQRSVGNRAVVALLKQQRPHADRTRPGSRSPLGSPVGLYRSTKTPAAAAGEPVFEPFKGQAINKPGQVSAPARQYEIARTEGVNLRARPDGTLPDIAKVLYGTDVHVQALDTTGAFSFVIARTGARGWINKDFVALDPPDLGSRLHHITEENLTTILENEYVDKGLWKLATGNDYTTLAAAVVVGNSGRKGVVVDWDAAAKYKKDHPWKGWLDPWMIDNFAIYHGSTVLAGHNIWLPSPTYVRMLQSSGVIGSRPGWVNAAVDVGKGIAGFIAGVVAGVLGSLWDTLTGLWDLAKGIVDAVRSALDGSLFASISDIYDTVSGMTMADVKRLVTEIVTMGQNAFADFERKWNHPDTYQQWHFKGSIIGAIALEVILAIFTGGGTFAAKVLAKIGKYFPKLMRVLDKLLDLAKKLPGRRDRDRPGDGDHRRDRDRDDEDLSNADRSWEQARALAALVTEEHDRLDTPVTTLIPMLDATVAAKFSGVSGYQAIPTGQPDTYKIVQRARRRDVDDHYTAKKEPKAPRFEFFRTLYGKSADQVWDRAVKVGWRPNERLRSGRGWFFTDENGVERFRFRRDKKGTWHHEQTGYIRWTDPSGHFLDVNGRVVTVNDVPIHIDMSRRHIQDVICNGDVAEFDRVMRETHISVDHLGGDW
jgi:hypothetical protein